MSKHVNTYPCSDGTRLKKTTIDNRIRKAKEAKIAQMIDAYGYVFCEDCNVNENCGVPLDCSHDISVDRCQKEGKTELAFDVENITIRCRKCHIKHD